MAISTQRSLAELAKEAESLGLHVTPAGKKLGKTDYILALRQWHLDHDFPNGVPEELTLMLKIESPMLCNRITELKPERQESIWNDKKWIAEEKEDGVRAVLPFIGGKLHMFSRNISVKDFLPVDYSENLWLDYCQAGLDKITDQFIVDAECVSLNPNINTVMGKKGVVTESQLQAVTAMLAMNSSDSIRIQKEENAPIEFRVFDCLWWNGEWLLDKPLIERKKYVKKALEQLKAAGLHCREPYGNYSNKKAFYNAIIAKGGEGVILKNLLSPYIASSNRSKEGFVKVKRNLRETLQGLKLADTLDGWVSGYEPGDPEKGLAEYVGSLDFSCHLKMLDGTVKEHVICRVSNIDLETRKEMTELDENGRPRLKKDWYGKVAELNCQCISSRALRGKHAVLVRWRTDKSMDACEMTEEFLRSMVL